MILITGNFLLAMLATAAFVSAAPLDNHSHVTTPLNGTINPRGNFGGVVDFFKREDCQNACIEKGYCLSGQATKGDMNPEGAGSWDSFSGKTCWDIRPGTKSVSLSQGDGWGYTWSDQSCKALGAKEKPAHFWDKVKGGVLASGLSRDDSKCSKVTEGMFSVSFDWMKRKEMGVS